jgi:hypothetical protein
MNDIVYFNCFDQISNKWREMRRLNEQLRPITGNIIAGDRDHELLNGNERIHAKIADLDRQIEQLKRTAAAALRSPMAVYLGPKWR